MKFDIKKLVDEALSKDFWYRALIMVVSMFVLAVNYNTFLLPNNIVFGGVSGIAIIVKHFFDVEASTTIMIGSLFLLLISYIFS